MSTLIGRIGRALDEKGLTFNRAEHDLGLGNGTIKRWAEQSPRLDKLVAVAGYLGLSLDYLIFGTLQTESTSNGETILCDGVPLTPLEADLVAMFRLLDARDKSTAFNFVEMLYQHMTGEKGSIYSTYTDDNDKQKSDPGKGHKAHGGTA